MTTQINYELLTDKELKEISSELGDKLSYMFPMDEEWDATYKEYVVVNAILDERYREENKEAFDKFYEKQIKDRTWEEIDKEE